jgi:hypothetical protein
MTLLAESRGAVLLSVNVCVLMQLLPMQVNFQQLISASRGRGMMSPIENPILFFYELLNFTRITWCYVGAFLYSKTVQEEFLTRS